jgi:lactate dehydrogenase-like 2-hydroxyacid dehydrogenase
MLLITRKMPPEVLARAKREHEVRELRLEGRFEPHHVLDNIDGIDAILCIPADKFDAALINALPAAVKVIGTFSVGLEHIDLEAAAARGIKICHTPDVLTTATAELSLTLMLMAARRAGEGWISSPSTSPAARKHTTGSTQRAWPCSSPAPS